MRNGKSLRKLLTLILSAALTIYLGNCKTAPVAAAEIAETLAIIHPPMPVNPLMEPVSFEDRDGGLWLSYNDFRSLERNIIAMREHAAKLEIIIRFYQGEQ